MAQLSRRHAIAGLAAVTAASATRSRSAKAAEPVTVWWTQGFYEAENVTGIFTGNGGGLTNMPDK